MNNSSFTPPDHRCVPPVFIWYTNPFNVSMFLLYLLVIIVALIGNVLVCIAVAINPILRNNIASYFIVSLAVSDIATASFSMPFDLEVLMTFGRWNHSELMCIVWTTAYLITVPSSIWNLFILSIDRYQTLKNPWDKFREKPFMTRHRALALISAVWIYCIACALSPEMGWRFSDAGSLVSYCTGTICIFNVTNVYMLLTAAVNFYLPMIAMCFIYYKIYRIASTQFITRPKSALLELKSDSPATTPKVKSKAKKQAQTDQKEHSKKRNDTGSPGGCKVDLGHDNLAMDHDAHCHNQNKMIRTSTMIEDIDLPGENPSHRHSYNLQEKGHAIGSVDGHGVTIKAVVNESSVKDRNDTQRQQQQTQLLPQTPEQQGKPKPQRQQQQKQPQLQLQQKRSQHEQSQPEQHEQSQSEQHEQSQPQAQQKQEEMQESRDPEQQLHQQLHHHHHKLQHQNALVSGENDKTGAADGGDGDDNAINDCSDDNNDVNGKSNDDDDDKHIDNDDDKGYNHCKMYDCVTGSNSDVHHDDNNAVNENNDGSTYNPNKEVKDNDDSGQNKKTGAESVITVQSAENADNTRPSDGNLAARERFANDVKHEATHFDQARVSFEYENGGSLSPLHSETYSIHKVPDLPIKRFSSDSQGIPHAGVSNEMHQYLRRQVSGEDRARYSADSHASICTVQSTVPIYGNNSHNIATSNETLNSFGSMEDLTKRQKIFVKNKKAARTIAIIVGTFLACWLPLTTSSVIKNICDGRCFVTLEERYIHVHIKVVFLLLGYLSSAINPFIYSYRNVQFRNSYRKIIRKLFPCLKTVIRPH